MAPIHPLAIWPMYHSPGVLLVCGGTSCSSLMKTGKKWRRKLAYSAVCTISMESRTSLANSTRLSIPAGTDELQLTLPLSLRGCSLVIFTWPQCACLGSVKHAAGPPCSAGHLTPLASLALECWPAAALKVQHQLVWLLLQSSLASRGDLSHDGQPHTHVKTCTHLTQVMSLLASLDTPAKRPAEQVLQQRSPAELQVGQGVLDGGPAELQQQQGSLCWSLQPRWLRPAVCSSV